MTEQDGRTVDPRPPGGMPAESPQNLPTPAPPAAPPPVGAVSGRGSPPAVPSGPPALPDTPVPGPPVGRDRPADGPEGALAISRFRGLWIAVTIFAIILLFLLIFILQNGAPADVTFLGATVTLPIGVALLLAAICGVLLVAIPGYLRIMHLRRALRRDRGAR